MQFFFEFAQKWLEKSDCFRRRCQGAVEIHQSWQGALRGNIVVRHNRFDAALAAHPGVAILHVNLLGQNEFMAEPGQELFIGIGAQYSRRERRSVKRQPCEYRFKPFETGLGQN